jgi:hypothetical protein
MAPVSQHDAAAPVALTVAAGVARVTTADTLMNEEIKRTKRGEQT